MPVTGSQKIRGREPEGPRPTDALELRRAAHRIANLIIGHDQAIARLGDELTEIQSRLAHVSRA